MGLFSFLKNDGSNRQINNAYGQVERPETDENSNESNPRADILIFNDQSKLEVPKRPLTLEEQRRREIWEERKKEAEYLNRSREQLALQCRKPEDNKYFIFYSCDEHPVFRTCEKQEHPFYMGIEVFPLPARPNDRLMFRPHKEIKQGLMLKMPKRMIEESLTDLGCVKEGQPVLTKLYEAQKYIAPNGTYFDLQDRGNARMISFSVDDNHTNRILFDIFDDLIGRTDSPVAATLYLDTQYPGKSIYETPAVMITANSWKRVHERAYPSYIDEQTAKILYLYDDTVPTLAYDRAWKASHPEKLAYWKNEDPEFKHEGAWRRITGTRWAWEYEDADLQRMYLNRVMDVAEKYCTETTPDYLINNIIALRKGPRLDAETQARFREYIGSRPEEEKTLINNGVEL